ncbi:hypothetical protein ACUTAF_07970 [Pseudomonas sp. SP16.1]|uniref:hypothetical protein n=1 Tax=Pseudomonas sp. SP16.1 TaxID=3458854 RepID=UPI0040453391
MMTIRACHLEREKMAPIISVTGVGVITTISGYFTAAQLRTLARQLITIANDADQGERGPVTYTTEE